DARSSDDHGSSLRCTQKHCFIECRRHMSGLLQAEMRLEAGTILLQVNPARTSLNHHHPPVGKSAFERIFGAVFGLAVNAIASKSDELAGFVQRRIKEAKWHKTIPKRY